MSDETKPTLPKSKHSISYAKPDIQLLTLITYVVAYFLPLSIMFYVAKYYLFPDHFFPETRDFLQWLLFTIKLFASFFVFLFSLLTIVGLIYRLVPDPAIGKKVETYSKDWLLWGIKAEIWKIVCDLPILYTFVLKTFLLRWWFFKLVGLKLHHTSMIATDVRIYEPHLLTVGRNCLLPVYSIFAGHLIMGKMMYMNKIRIGDNVSIGARSGFSPGVEIGDNCILGFNCLFGVDVKVGKNCVIDSNSAIADGSVIGDNVFIGKEVVLGRKCQIADGVKIPDYVKLPPKAVIKTKADIYKYIAKSAIANAIHQLAQKT